MLRSLRLLAAVSLPCLLAACAAPPTAGEMANVPVVRYGDKASGPDFVLFYPAHTPLTVRTGVNGTLFDAPAQTELKVALTHDLYTYRQWASLDGLIWQPGDRLVKSEMRIEVPGAKDGRNPGALTATFDSK